MAGRHPEKHESKKPNLRRVTREQVEEVVVEDDVDPDHDDHGTTDDREGPGDAGRNATGR